MWTTVLLVVHLMIAVALIGLVLMQRSEGGALGIGGSGGGGGGFLTGRGTANLLTRATAALALAFFFTSMGLTVLANRQLPAGSVFDRVNVPAPAQPAGTSGATPASAPATPATPSGGVLDALKEGRGLDRFKAPAPGTPAAPASNLPAPPAVPAPADTPAK